MFGINFFIPLTFHRNCFPVQKSSSQSPNWGTLEAVTEVVDIFIAPLIKKTLLVINQPNKLEKKSSSFYLKVDWTKVPISSRQKDDGCLDSKIGNRSCAFKVISIILYLLIFPIVIALILKLILRLIIRLKYNPIIHLKYDPIGFPPSYVLPEFSPEQQARIHELHIALTKLTNETKSLKKVPKEKLDALGLTILKTIYINNSEHNFFPVFTSKEFPGLIFKSLPIKYAQYSYTSSLISNLIIRENNLNLLRVPRVLYMDSEVENSLGEECSLVVEEQLSLSFEGPLNSFMDRYNVHAIPTLEQLFTFISKTSFHENYKIRICDGGSSDSPPVVGLLDLKSVEILPREEEDGLSLSLSLWFSSLALKALSAEQWSILKQILSKVLPLPRVYYCLHEHRFRHMAVGIDIKTFLNPGDFGVKLTLEEEEEERERKAYSSFSEKLT